MKINKKSLHENVIIITGASSGIGQQLALRLAEQGAWLALAARNSFARRKRDVVMTFEGKSGLWLRLIAPKLVDRILRKRTTQSD